MFSGIITNLGTLNSKQKKHKGFLISIKTNIRITKKDVGTSFSCSGVCLTLTSYKKLKKKILLFFFVSHHTYQLSNFLYSKIGDKINLERSLKYGSRFDGHFVQGHIDKTLKIKKIEIKSKKYWFIYIGFNKNDKKYLVKKGSICINGVSLTIVKIYKNQFSLMIIPHTLINTNLINLKANDLVNIEFDLIVKTLKN
ncbi:MAG: riboflavin synthase [Candidatus Fonsibacter sp.]|jgi:riboflavin synthase